MQTNSDYQKAIIKALEEHEKLNFKQLERKVNIATYQERGKFLKALTTLEIKGEIYNLKRGTYTIFPKEKFQVDTIVKDNDDLVLEQNKHPINEINKQGHLVLLGDIVITTKEEIPRIIKILSRNLSSFQEFLLNALKETDLTYKQIKHLFLAKDREKVSNLKNLLNDLESKGKIYLNGNIYQSWPNTLTLTKLQLDSKGYPYFDLDGKRIYKSKTELEGAIEEDLIAVSNSTKKITKIIKRNNHEIILEVVEKDGIKTLEPILIPGRSKINVRISSIDMKKLKLGDRITANISLEKTNDNIYEAEYISTIGNITDKDIDIISLATKYGFKINFSEAALNEADLLPNEITAKDLVNRFDFRHRFNIFTIDCDNTKDIDDAVSIMKNENGNYILGVHIAHVSHYVKRGSILDLEAYERGLSVYPANMVIPNLPKKLSNGICSLNPNEPRLTRSCIMEISPSGELLNYNLVNSVIESKLKMSYSKVNKLLTENIYDASYAPFVNDLKLLEELSDILTKKRLDEGMLTFAETETSFIEDENGNITDIENKSNGKAGKIIENAMILYNHCQSIYLNYIVGTSINRIHQAPDQRMLTNAINKLKSLGYNIPNPNGLSPNEFIMLTLNKYYNTNDYSIVSNVLLRSMPRAAYSPYKEGHFGLGLNYYTHSTSPIRRYPDLKAQQIIDSYQQGALDEIEDTATLEEICEHCTLKEQQADALEREIELIKMLNYVERHPDKCYYALVTNIDETKAYLSTITNIPGYMEYHDIPNIHYVSSRKQLKNNNDQVVLKIGDFVHVQTNYADHKELSVNFDILKNITLEEQNQKGSSLLNKNKVKRYVKTAPTT